MKIEVDEEHNITLSEVYEGIVIQTKTGMFGVCERDGGIEVTFKGKLVYAKYPERTREGFLCQQCGVPLGLEDAGFAKCSYCRVTG
jgi:hypothetical protein